MIEKRHTCHHYYNASSVTVSR